MKVGDILVFTGSKDHSRYTTNKWYRIYKIDNGFIPGTICGWIYDDDNSSVYFRKDKDLIIRNKDWISLKELRKLKLEKINKYIQ